MRSQWMQLSHSHGVAITDMQETVYCIISRFPFFKLFLDVIDSILGKLFII
jgi:hypothetical protein